MFENEECYNSVTKQTRILQRVKENHILKKNMGLVHSIIDAVTVTLIAIPTKLGGRTLVSQKI